jgi:putative ABC transport system permease protein
MQPGSTFSAIMNGRKRTLTVTAIVLSPEYVYAIGPGDMVPDQRRFGIFFMPRTVLAGIFDMNGAFNDLSVRTLRGADIPEVIDRIDALLEAYGGSGAHDRTTQVSHSFLDNELLQLRAMASIIPPIFLFVSAFLVNMILSRMIALEREQIGLLKALGYGDFAIAWHYVKFTLVVAVIGSAIGAGVGVWTGRAMTRLYAEFFYFPFLIFRQSIDLHFIAIGTSVAAALLGALRAIKSVVDLPAAVAMQPPVPLRHRAIFGDVRWLRGAFSQLTIMVVRNLVRRPLRTFLTTLGTSLSVALLITALFSFDSIDYMIETVFTRAERQDATLVFNRDLSSDVVESVRNLPGIMRVEPFRALNVVLRNGHREKQVSIMSISPDADLTQVLDVDMVHIDPPPAGLLLTERLARYLGLSIGDLVEVELLDKGHRLVLVPVTSIFQAYVGLTVNMRDDALARLAGDGELYSGARVTIDSSRMDAFHAEIKSVPAIAGVALLGLSLKRFRETIGENITIFTTVYLILALIITFGVIYNSARIQLSEQARELASLRVLGFTRAEVSSILLGELAVIVLMAQPLGWVLGYAFARLMTKGFESDLFRIPFIIEDKTYAMSSLLVIAAAVFSALIVRRRIDRLDLVSVLKTRE